MSYCDCSYCALDERKKLNVFFLSVFIYFLNSVPQHLKDFVKKNFRKGVPFIFGFAFLPPTCFSSSKSCVCALNTGPHQKWVISQYFKRIKFMQPWVLALHILFSRLSNLLPFCFPDNHGRNCE